MVSGSFRGNDIKQTLDHSHVSLTKSTRWSKSKPVSLRGVIENWIGAAISLKGTVRATRKRLIAGSLLQFQECGAGEKFFSRVLMNISDAKCEIVHFGEHSRFVGGVHIAIVVVDQHIPASTGGRLKINKAGSKRRQNFH